MVKRSIPALLFLFGMMSAWCGDPKPYSVNRYSILWQSQSFQSIPQASQTKATQDESSGEWAVAGIFSIDGKQGAIVMNLKTRVVEQVGTDFVSPSGIRLTRVHTSKAGQSPKIEVSKDGERLMLTGIPNTPGKASPLKKRQPGTSPVALRSQ